MGMPRPISGRDVGSILQVGEGKTTRAGAKQGRRLPDFDGIGPKYLAPAAAKGIVAVGGIGGEGDQEFYPQEPSQNDHDQQAGNEHGEPAPRPGPDFGDQSGIPDPINARQGQPYEQPQPTASGGGKGNGGNVNQDP